MPPAPRPQGPAFVVHDLKQALAVLRAAAELDRPVVLVSPPAAAAIEGALWFRELIAMAAAQMPAAGFEAVIDCGDHPGYVLESLSLGLKWVRFHGGGEARLAELAQAHGATLIGEELGEIDLETAEDPGRIARSHLSAPRR
jgi:fructose/tagatose bisphosphate aldolase